MEADRLGQPRRPPPDGRPVDLSPFARL